MLCLYKNSAALPKRWRGRGIKAITYIDDGIIAFSGFEIAKPVSELVRLDIFSAGCVINNEKSSFNPKIKGKWLGTIIDTRELTFTIPQEKILNTFRGYYHVFKSGVFWP